VAPVLAQLIVTEGLLTVSQPVGSMPVGGAVPELLELLDELLLDELVAVTAMLFQLS